MGLGHQVARAEDMTEGTCVCDWQYGERSAYVSLLLTQLYDPKDASSCPWGRCLTWCIWLGHLGEVASLNLWGLSSLISQGFAEHRHMICHDTSHSSTFSSVCGCLCKIPGLSDPSWSLIGSDCWWHILHPQLPGNVLTACSHAPSLKEVLAVSDVP